MGDEVHEVNGMRVTGKNPTEIVDILVSGQTLVRICKLYS